MKTLRTLSLTSFLFSVSAAGLAACPNFAEEHGIDYWNYGTYQQQLDAAEKKRLDMERENELVVRRIEFKEEIVRDLIDQRISFDEAASRFEDSNRNLQSAANYVLNFPGRNNHERACWQLVAYLRTGRGETASQLAVEWEARLTSQLKQS